MLNSEEIKPITLVVIDLHLSEGIRQSDSQSVKNLLNKKSLKFLNNSIQKFRVDLKTFLGLALPNQCCQKVNI